MESMDEAAAMQAFVEHMLTYTIRLVRAKPNEWPFGIASGFVIPVAGRYRIVSAGHAIAAASNWVMETVPESETETLMLIIKAVHSVAKIPRRDKTNSLDLAWADLNPEELKEQLAKAPKKPRTDLELPTYIAPLDAVPDPETAYGFAAWNNVEAHPMISTLRRESRYEFAMRFVGIHPKNKLYLFEPAREFQGHEYYEGASGAPIADPNGLIISMLVGGDRDEKYLWGVPLAKHAKKLTAP